ncbi:MAG: proteasome assembly chaperone family protein, partial [Thermoprotei archaeon]
MSIPSFRVVEMRSLEWSEPYLINGLPDIGLVGTISAVHLIKQFSASEMAYLESELIPPVIILHNGAPKMPIRIYGWDKFYVVTSDIAIPPEAISPLSRCITEYAVSKNVKLVISLGGIAAPNRLEIKKPKVYGVASGKEAKEVLDKAGIEPLSEGVIVGTYAMILKECLMRRVPSIILLAQAHSHYPDPGAAASVLEALSKILGIEIDVA